MRRLPRSTYALLVSLLPATATVIGLVVLGQVPTGIEVLGVALVVGGVAASPRALGEPPERPVAAARLGSPVDSRSPRSPVRLGRMPPASVRRARSARGERAPAGRARASASRCSSDRRKTIVLHVKPMSSHQRRAGTTKCTSRSAPRTSSPSRSSRSRRSPQSGQRDSIRAALRAGVRDAERVPGAVRVPRAPAVLDAVGVSTRRERVEHPDRGRVWREHESVASCRATEPMRPPRPAERRADSVGVDNRARRRRSRRRGCEYRDRARPPDEYPPSRRHS